MKKTFTLALACLMLGSASFAQKKVDSEKAEKFAKEIKAKKLKDILSVIASAEMEGRETAMPGQRKAAAWIENYFKTIGLEPGNGSSYQMQYPLFRDSVAGATLSVNNQQFVLGKDFNAGVATPGGKWNWNDVAFVGNGRIDSVNNDLAGIDVKGKMLMIVNGPVPAGAQGGGRGGNAAMMQRLQSYRTAGAVGILVVSNINQNAPVQRLGGMSLKAAAPATFVTLTISPAVAKAIMGGDVTLTPGQVNTVPSKVYNTAISFNFDKVTQNLQSSNVIGVIPGTDKKDEYVFVTGHYDHLGKRGDSVIYYGADDDGSGTTGVLNIATAFAEAKKKGNGPRRTMIFMTVSGEEKGLLGSEYYGDHPTVDLKKATVDLNIDMVGRIDPTYKGDSTNYVFVIGDDKLSSDLKPITDDVNAKYGINMQLDRRYNDITDPNRFYYRSDHYNFAKNGVPIIFYFNGTHADYHRPTDTVDKINFDLMEKRVRLVYYTAWEMANRDDMLKRDIPLNVPAR
jgi:hypothetical protein